MTTNQPAFDINKLSLTEVIQKKYSIENHSFVDVKKLKVDFNIVMNSAVNIDSNAVKIEFIVDVDIASDETIFKEVGQFEVDFIFHYKELNDLVSKDDSVYILDTQATVNCAALSYSTLRGIIIVHAMGTCLEKMILPVISARDLVKSTAK